jgi:hypothetical protein
MKNSSWMTGLGQHHWFNVGYRATYPSGWSWPAAEVHPARASARYRCEAAAQAQLWFAHCERRLFVFQRSRRTSAPNIRQRRVWVASSPSAMSHDGREQLPWSPQETTIQYTDQTPWSHCLGSAVPRQSGSGCQMEHRRGSDCAELLYVLCAWAEGLHRLTGARLTTDTLSRILDVPG